MRYLVEDVYFKKQEDGPIFYYVGGEGGIINFYENSGFITKELCKDYKALVIFAEHRSYGRSELPDYKHLTINQTIEDHKSLIEYLQQIYSPDGIKKRPVILFGASYGGMIATWLRQKYPA